MHTGATRYVAIVAAEEAIDTSTQLFLYHLSFRHSAMMRTIGGQSMAWKKPLAHQTGMMISTLGKQATSRLQQHAPARPANIIIWGLNLSPRTPQIICPNP